MNGQGQQQFSAVRSAIVIAAVFVVIAGLRAAEPILVPILLSLFLSVLSIPAVLWLQRNKVPDWAAVPLVFIGVLVGFGLLTMFIGKSVTDFQANLPGYEDELRNRVAPSLSGVAGWFEMFGVDVSTDTLLAHFDPKAVINVFQAAAGAVVDVLSQTFLVLVTVAFMLGEAAGFPKKLREAVDDPTADLGEYSKVIDSVQKYLGIKTQVSLVTGILAALLLLALGVDFPLLWGLMAFLLNFIPTVGSLIAAVPPLLMALVQYGWERALIVLVGYFVINTLMGNVIEPKLMGRKLGLSSLVVFLSLLFWGWVWGPIGMLLSVPLTMVVKIALEQSEDLRWVAVLLGPGGEEIPVEHPTDFELSQSQLAIQVPRENEIPDKPEAGP